MTLFLFASTIIAAIIISSNIRRQKKNREQSDKNFWARELRANSVRRKPIDGLGYIKIPLEDFPTHILQQDPVVSECISVIEDLTSQKILNLWYKW